MNEKLRALLSGDRKKAAILVAAVVGVVLLAMSAIIPSEKDNKAAVENTGTQNVSDYAELTEARLKKVLESIDGAGATRVMITYECGSESVYGENSSQRLERDDGSFSSSEESDYILVDSGSVESGLLLYVREPRVRGVAVMCEGGASPQVKKAITDAVTALFGIGDNRVSVAKMNKNPEE